MIVVLKSKATRIQHPVETTSEKLSFLPNGKESKSVDIHEMLIICRSQPADEWTNNTR